MKKFNLLALLCSSLFVGNYFADNEPFFIDCNQKQYTVKFDHNQQNKLWGEKLRDGTINKAIIVCRSMCHEIDPPIQQGKGAVEDLFGVSRFSVECDDNYIAHVIKSIKFNGNIVNGYKVSDEFCEKYEQFLKNLKNKNVDIAQMIYQREVLHFSEDEVTIFDDLLKKYGQLIEKENNTQENNVTNVNTTHKDSGFLGFNRVRSFFSGMIKARDK